MIEVLVLGGLVILFNILDSVTTEWFLDRTLGDGLETQEGNPFVRKELMYHPVRAHAMKQGGIFALVSGIIWGAWFSETMHLDETHKMIVWTLIFMAVLLGLVVLNNAYIDVMKWRTGKRWHSPYTALIYRLGLGDSWVYPVAMVGNMGISVAVASLLVRL